MENDVNILRILEENTRLKNENYCLEQKLYFQKQLVEEFKARLKEKKGDENGRTNEPICEREGK